MVVETRSSGGQGLSVQENNQQSFAFDTHIKGTTGKHRVYVHILSSGDIPQVRLYLYGLASNLANIKQIHAANGHIHTVYLGGSAYSGTGYASIVDHSGLTNGTDVPQEVTIWIDGTEKTANIGDPNSKGATMWDSVNEDWGINGTTEWNTGELNLTSLISWGVGEHYIEFRCSGTGGRLLGNVFVN